MDNLYKDKSIKYGFDIVMLLDSKGKVMYRANNPSCEGDNISDISIIKKAIHDWVPVKGTFALDEKYMKNEGESILKRTVIKIHKTLKMEDALGKPQESRGMFVGVAIPLTSKADNKKYDLWVRTY